MGVFDIETVRLIRMGLLAFLAAVAVTLEAVPLGLTATARPSPDLLFCVVAYWAVRRPSATPAVLVFMLGLYRDLLTDVPPGIGALSLMAASEILRSRSSALRHQPIATEWGTVASVAALMLAGQWLVVLMSFAQPAYLVDLGWQWFYTVLLQPVLALILRWPLRIGWETASPKRAAPPPLGLRDGA